MPSRSPPSAGPHARADRRDRGRRVRRHHRHPPHRHRRLGARPALLVDALGRTERRYRVEILSNIDGQAVDEALGRLDPATTLVAIASKTFTTAETLRNADAALAWLEEPGSRIPMAA
jgi:hypothetical protein